MKILKYFKTVRDWYLSPSLFHCFMPAWHMHMHLLKPCPAHSYRVSYSRMHNPSYLFFFLFYFEYAHSLGPVIIPAFSLAFHHQSPPPHRLHLPLPLPVSFYSCHTFYDGDCMRRWFCCWPCSAPAPTHGLPALSLSPSLCLSVRLPWLAEQDVLGAVVRVLKWILNDLLHVYPGQGDDGEG